ncbi:MAG: DUF92 domain-containing protein [Anaerolineaceae bacterium]
MLQFGLGTLLAILISMIAWRLRLLSSSGMIAAIVMGALIFGLGGLAWASLLIGFFVISSLLSRLARSRKANLDEKYAKGSQRDAWQVIANGGVATIILVLTHLQPKVTGCNDTFFATGGWAFLAFAGSLAAANADTWATELGVFSRKAPRLIITGRRVPLGTSGAISPVGSLASLAGSLFIAGLTALPWAGVPHPLEWQLTVLLVGIAGFIGSFVDSTLGATLQAIYYCPSCDKETEKYPLHTCGTTTRQIRGLRWMNNDAVNFACTLGGAIIVWVVYLLIR